VSQGLPDATAEKSVARVPAFPVLNVLAPQRHRSRLGSGRGLCTPDAARCAEQSCAELLVADGAEPLELQPALPALALAAVGAPLGLQVAADSPELPAPAGQGLAAVGRAL